MYAVVGGWILMGVQATLNAVRMAAAWLIAMGPIALVIVAVLGLVALIIANWDTIKNVTVEVWSAVSGAVTSAVDFVVGWVKDHWGLLLGLLTGPIGPAIQYIVEHWDSIVATIKGLPGRLASAGAGMWSWVWTEFKGAINNVLRGWNRLEFKIPSFDTHLPGVGRIGGVTIGVPDIPLLAKGGTLTSAGSVFVGEHGPELLDLPAGATVRPLTPDGSGMFRLHPEDIELLADAIARRPVELDGARVNRQLGLAATARGRL
jgi:hypothetical protein